uniref:Inositol-tetrakisphosphate 1-kinase n=2 Tax=Canidae TaxID=9608 RepID=A0A8P0TDZ8_CANLF
VRLGAQGCFRLKTLPRAGGGRPPQGSSRPFKGQRPRGRGRLPPPRAPGREAPRLGPTPARRREPGREGAAPLRGGGGAGAGAEAEGGAAPWRPAPRPFLRPGGVQRAGRPGQRGGGGAGPGAAGAPAARGDEGEEAAAAGEDGGPGGGGGGGGGGARAAACAPPGSERAGKGLGCGPRARTEGGEEGPGGARGRACAGAAGGGGGGGGRAARPAGSGLPGFGLLRAPSGSGGRARRRAPRAAAAGGGRRRRAAGGGGVGGGGGSQWPAALSAAPSAPPRPAGPAPPRPAPPRPAPPGRTARPEPRSASPPPEEVPARSRRTPGPPRSACGRFPPDPSSPPEEEDADVSEGEESWLLAEREENQEAEFPGLRRAVQLNLSRPIEEQGPLDVIIHKLTDVILEADQNDSQSLELVHRFQEYIDAHPETIVLDPLPAIRTLLDRSKSYELIRKIEAYMKDDRICSPPFMELTSLSGDDTMRLLEQNGLAFPFICKTRVAHGTNSHEMAIVFNQEGLSAIQPPCVVQNFINHNAVLYKVFVVGESYTVVQRPSLKNFSAGTSDRESIFFNSHNVSKPESSSVLTALDKIEGVFERPSDEVIRELSRALRQALGVSLFGIDIIINNQTGQHAVIDINAFPGYEGVSEFFTDLLNHVATVLQGQSTATAAAGDVAPLRHSRLLAEQAGSLAGERTCSAGPGCCGSMMGPDPPWTSEADAGGMGAGGTAKLPHQRLGCTAAVSPSFQQHCVASLATKASSQ